MITSQQLRALRNDEIDIGFARLNEDDLPPETYAALDDPYCVAVSNDSPVARQSGLICLRDVAEGPFVAFIGHQEATYRDRTIALCQEAGYEPIVRHEAGDWSSVLGFIACGLGVGIVPGSFSTLPLPGVAFRRIGPSRHHGRLAILANARSVNDPCMQQVLGLGSATLGALGVQLKVFGSLGVRVVAG